MNGAKSLVHGYVRMAEPDETEIALMCKDLGTFCTLNSYRLGSIFIDRGVRDEVRARTGFIDLLAAVRLTGAHAVVMPTLDHLSSDDLIQAGLIRMVQVAGSQVLVAYEDRSPACEVGEGLGASS